jgi:quercetin dioxygenase-like cupin family protein
MNEDEFRQQLQERGYGDAQIKEFDPTFDKEMHTHEFSAMALVVSGEFILALESGPTSYGPGDWCELEAGTVHAERTGPSGATILLALKQL